MQRARTSFRQSPHRGWVAAMVMCGSAALAAPRAVQAQATLEMPFAIGERLNYRVTVGSRRVGEGSMSVQGPEDVRGVATYVLRAEVHARIGPIKAVDR